MKVYRLHRQQVLPLTLEECWEFFSSPRNLSQITPGYMNFRIVHISGPSEAMFPGQIIRYKVNIFRGIPVDWTTEITQVVPHTMFIDEQRTGPYALWHHAHHFRETESGVEMTDEVHYALPFGLLGRMAHGLLVKKQLKTIFDYRKYVLAQRFR